MSVLNFSESSKPKVPDGKYAAKFSGYRSVETRFGTPLLLQFEITTGGHAGTVVSCFAKESRSSSSKLAQIVTALLNQMPEGEIDLDGLIGAECIIHTSTVDTKNETFSVVSEVEPKQ